MEENCQALFGTTQPPLLLTAPEQVHFVKGVLADEEPGRWPLYYRRMLHTHTLAEELADFMLRCGEQRITPEELAELAVLLDAPLPVPPPAPRRRRAKARGKSRRRH